jgi:hypothetical protein
MADAPLVTAGKRWDQLAAQAQAAGIPTSAIVPVAKYDLQRVASGKSQMTNEEAILAVTSAARGTPVIQDKAPRTNLASIPRNFASDLSHIVFNFVPGLAKFAYHLPSETTKTIQGLPTALQGKDLGQDIRNVASLPLAALIPGLHDVADLTSKRGIQDLIQHPAGALVDILPAAGKLGELALAGDAVEAGSAAEALASGSPIKAGFRAAAGTAEAGSRFAQAVESFAEAPITPGPRTSMLASAVAKRFGFDAASSQFARWGNVIGRKAHREAVAEADKFIPELVRQLPAEDRPALMRVSELGGTSDPYFQTENGRVIGQVVQNLNTQAAIVGLQEHAVEASLSDGTRVSLTIGADLYNVPTPHGVEPYAVESPVVGAHKGLVKAGDRVMSVAEEVRSIQYWDESPKTVRMLKKYQKAKEAYKAAQKKFDKTLLDNPAARYHPRLKQDLMSHLAEHYHGDNIKQLTEAASWEELQKAFGDDKLFKELQTATRRSWLELAKQGFDPVYMSHVDPHRFDYQLGVNPIPDAVFGREAFTRNRNFFNMEPGVQDGVVAMTAPMMDIVRTKAQREFVETAILPHGIMKSKVVADVRAILRDKHPDPNDLNTAAQDYINTRYTPLDLNQMFGSGKVRLSTADEILIPNELDRAMKQLMPSKKMPVKGLLQKSTGVYKVAVLTSPRHLAHIAMGGLSFMMLREPQAISKLASAYNMTKLENAADLPVELSTDIHNIASEHTFDFLSAKSAGRWFQEAGGKAGAALDQFRKFEDHVANTYRVATMLSGEARGLDQMAAIELANKVFIDMDHMSPFERTIIKQVSPFYSFTKHLFRYLFTYPVDHPYRAAILTRFAEQEAADWKSGLPGRMQNLLFIGHPDKSGNVANVDLKVFNPFRSLYSDFTLTGFLSGLNPALTTVMQAAGINTLAGAPDLYAGKSYDAQNGTWVADRPKRSPLDYAAGYIPQVSAFDQMLGITDRYRQLKASDPAAFKRALLSDLGIPFVQPKYPVKLEEAKTEIRRLQDAQAEVSSGAGTGHIPTGYNLVPVPAWLGGKSGQLATPQQLNAYLQAVIAQFKAAGVPSNYSVKSLYKAG